MLGFLKKLFGTAQDRKVKRFRKMVAEIHEQEEKLHALTDEQLTAKTEEFRQRLSDGESLDSLLPEAYAVVKNCCRRMCGMAVHVSGYEQQWDMIPYDVQIIGGIAMHYGHVAEMMTGEGKTLTAVMPLYLNALTGKPTHLVTVNDYLAQRDCQWVGTVLRKLGMTVGALTNDTPNEERAAIYNCDVVYGTSSEFGFDYLRDNSMAFSKEHQVQRGYYFAIVDEVDSILIDECRTPLIISGPVSDGESRQQYNALKGAVSQLVKMQRELTSRMATEVRKVLLKHELLSGRETSLSDLSKEAQKEVKEALKHLWLVGKGTPRNRVLKRVMESPDLRAALDEWDLYFYSDANKDEKREKLSQLFINVDEKLNEFELTDKGIQGWVQATGSDEHRDDFIMVDLVEEFQKVDSDSNLSDEERAKRKVEIQDEDALRKERAHNLRQLLRAHLMTEKDVDYIIQDNQVVIIDENTGRPQPGRRFGDGLHQAIEAKEGVEVQKETQTYATITLQNYFRMYKKLAGMTGTAITEAGEFKEIYKLEILEIPTHRPCKRNDFNDEIYMTEREKYTAILKEVEEAHKKGQPVLIGTESVESSEKLSRILRQRKLPHTVLNAKQHASEAEVVAQAGQKGAITVATNMAGRGTDIKLAPEVAELGGLMVIGITRHQSRRIDRQLRGRCARQGDPGSAKFYISFEDKLLRLFASPGLTNMLQRFRPPEGEPISANILNKSIETAQKRIEQRNSQIRKHTLEYDDVMNKHRQEIYTFRNELLHSTEIVDIACEQLDTLCAIEAERFCSQPNPEEGWDLEGLRNWLSGHFPIPFEEDFFQGMAQDLEAVIQRCSERVTTAFRERVEQENNKILLIQPPTDPSAPAVDFAQKIVRSLMLRKLDDLWQEHLLSMDHLRADVTLRAVAQKDPLMEFKSEAFSLFDELSQRLRQEIGKDLFKFRIVTQAPTYLDQVLSNMQMEKNRSLAEDLEEPTQPEAPSPQENKGTPLVAEGPKAKRNAPCPCGSGKKYKQCCGITQAEPV